MFLSTFSALTVVTLIFYLKIAKAHFHTAPFWSILTVKYLFFGQNLPIRTTHHIFVESGHPEVTKNPYCVLSLEGSQKKVSAHGLLS